MQDLEKSLENYRQVHDLSGIMSTLFYMLQELKHNNVINYKCFLIYIQCINYSKLDATKSKIKSILKTMWKLGMVLGFTILSTNLDRVFIFVALANKLQSEYFHVSLILSEYPNLNALKDLQVDILDFWRFLCSLEIYAEALQLYYQHLSPDLLSKTYLHNFDFCHNFFIAQKSEHGINCKIDFEISFITNIYLVETAPGQYVQTEK